MSENTENDFNGLNQSELADLKSRVHKLESQEQVKKLRKWKILTRKNAAIWVAIITVIGISVGNFLVQHEKNSADISLENKKFKSTMLLQAFNTPDTTEAVKRLLFYINHNLIEDHDSSLRKSANNPIDLPILGFNKDNRDFPTVMVSNVSKQKCPSGPTSACWSEQISANLGDTIAVQIYFHNPTIYVAEDVQIGINPEISPRGTFHIFSGAVASTTILKSEGMASVITPSPLSISFIPGSVRKWKHGQIIVDPIQNEYLLFREGIPIGDVSPGWSNQGEVVAMFRVTQ